MFVKLPLSKVPPLICKLANPFALVMGLCLLVNTTIPFSRLHSNSANCYLVLRKFNVRKASVHFTFSGFSEVDLPREKPKMFYYCFTLNFDLIKRMDF